MSSEGLSRKVGAVHNAQTRDTAKSVREVRSSCQNLAETGETSSMGKVLEQLTLKRLRYIF